MRLHTLAIATLTAGCGANQLAQSWEIDRTRILAVRAEPAEPAPGDRVTFEALTVHPEFDIESVIWMGCLSEEADSFGCEVDQAALEALFEGDLEDLTPEQQQELFEQAVAAGLIGVEPFLPPTYDVPGDILDGLSDEERAEGLNLFLTLTAVPAVEGRALDEALDIEVAYKRVPVSITDTPNHNPAIAHLTADEQVITPGSTLVVPHAQAVEITPVLTDDSLETYTYVDSDGVAESRVEEPYFTYYLTDGALNLPFSLHPYGFDFTYPLPEESTSGCDPRTEESELEACLRAAADEQPPAELTLYVVVRDRRGGMNWLVQPIRVE